ncbi:MAG: tRNA uridine-5-carboxymethylaminomethyl(34) synthesis GTPase MnmE [Sphingomonadaceae bacterium]
MDHATIFALSSGLPPAGIAVIRVSGPAASDALRLIAGRVPRPRLARLARFRHPVTGMAIDQGLALWFLGPASVTGEDLAEFHVHGGRAVVAAMLAAVGAIAGCRQARAGEFTQRGFENGRIDLAQAEGLAELLAAETEGQRQSALAMVEGQLGARIAGWQAELLRISAQIEAELDFSDEGDVADQAAGAARLTPLIVSIAALLDAPGAERLRDGVRVVLAGPPNAGKSSLFNQLAGRDAAIVTPMAGTTRDLIEAPIQLGGVPILLIDTAGLRDASDAIEAMGVERAQSAMARADIILWLGDKADMPSDDRALLIASKADVDRARPGLAVSSITSEGIAALTDALVERARAFLPREGALALNARHRSLMAAVRDDLRSAQASDDMLIAAEHLRTARALLDQVTGRAGVEDMLDALFGGLCIGK